MRLPLTIATLLISIEPLIDMARIVLNLSCSMTAETIAHRFLVGEILAVYDLSEEDVADPSDFAIRDGEVFILGDHENDEAVPPVSQFTIEMYSAF